MNKSQRKAVLYLFFAAAIATFLGWLYYKHTQLAAKIGLGGTFETVAPQLQTTLIAPEDQPYVGAPL